MRGGRTGLVVVAILLASACSSGGEGAAPSPIVETAPPSAIAPATTMLYGYFELWDDDAFPSFRKTDEEAWDEFFGESFPGCLGVGGYSDIITGARVGLYDAEGTLWSSASLEGGATIPGEDGERVCRWSFRFEDAPSGFDYYLVGVANRSKVAFTASELRDVGYFYITLGQD